MRGCGVILGLVLAAFTSTGPAMAEETTELLSFADLDGWVEDDHAAALSVFRDTCADMDGPEWQALCALADTAPDPRSFFELFFRPVLIGGERAALFTGYFEPELDGSRVRTGRYRYPLYRTPRRGARWRLGQPPRDRRGAPARGAWPRDRLGR